MGKTSTKLAVYALVQLLLFHLSGLVAAVDFFFRMRADACRGSAYMYEDILPYRCEPAINGSAGSVEVSAIAIDRTEFYGGGRCFRLKFSALGSRCAVGGGYTGANWSHILRHEAENACDALTKPTGTAYSEESTEGRWILTTDNVTEMYTQMDTIPDAQKVDWLQAHGATFKP